MRKLVIELDCQVCEAFTRRSVDVLVRVTESDLRTIKRRRKGEDCLQPSMDDVDHFGSTMLDKPANGGHHLRFQIPIQQTGHIGKTRQHA